MDIRPKAGVVLHLDNITQTLPNFGDECISRDCKDIGSESIVAFLCIVTNLDATHCMAVCSILRTRLKGALLRPQSLTCIRLACYQHYVSESLHEHQLKLRSYGCHILVVKLYMIVVMYSCH